MAFKSFSPPPRQVHSVQLDWQKNLLGDNWHSLKDLNLGTVKTSGVYVIRTTIGDQYYVYVGQGDIADRLSAHLRDISITKYASAGSRSGGNLWVAWAPVSIAHRNGFERYLHDKLKPRESRCWTTDPIIVVNLP